MTNSAEFGWRTTAQRGEVAALFRDIAEKLDRDGKVDVEHGGVELKLQVPDTVNLEVELDVEENEFELEIELKWPLKAPPSKPQQDSSSQQPQQDSSSQQPQQESASKTDARLPPVNPGAAGA